jgi:glucokinase
VVKRLVGVDIGGTGIKMGAVEVGDEPRVRATDVLREHAGRPPDEVLPDVALRLGRLAESSGWDELDAVGVGSAGLVNRHTGEVAFSPNLPSWPGATIKATLTALLNVPVVVDNDVNAFALAEWRWGAGEGSPHVVFLTLGTGIGGAVISDARLLRGAAGFAGEPGHTTLVLGGRPCPCGNLGCAERYIGSKALVEEAERHPRFGDDPELRAARPLTPLALTRAAEQGSEVAREVMTGAGRALGGLLVSLINVINPERVVIGGGVAQAGDLLLDPARDHVSRHSLVARFSPPRILPAALGEAAGLLGAAALALGDDDSG